MTRPNVWLSLLWIFSVLALPGLMVGAISSNVHDPNLWIAGIVNALFYAWVGLKAVERWWPGA